MRTAVHLDVGALPSVHACEHMHTHVLVQELLLASTVRVHVHTSWYNDVVHVPGTHVPVKRFTCTTDCTTFLLATLKVEFYLVHVHVGSSR